MSAEHPPSDGTQAFKIRSLLWSVYIPSFLLQLGQGILIPVLPLFARDSLHASDALIGLVVAARLYGTMLFDVPAGLLGARLGTRWTMVLGAGLFSLAAVGGGLSTNVALLFTARLFTGISFALWSISRHAYIATAVPVNVRGKALSLFGGVSRVATVLGPLAGGLTAQYISVRFPFFLQAGVAAATLLLVMVTMRDVGAAPIAHGNMVQDLRKALADRKQEFAAAGTAAIAIQFMRQAREFIVPVWGDDIGLSKAAIGYVTTVSYAIDSVMFPLVGYVMDRWGRKFTGVPAFAILGLSMGLIPLAHNFYGLMAVAALAGLGNGLSSGFVLTLGADLAPRDNPGGFLGVWRLVSDSGGALAPTVIGTVKDLLGITLASLTTTGLGGIGVLVLIFGVKETLTKGDRKAPAAPTPTNAKG